jgi:hypothetical protein
MDFFNYLGRRGCFTDMTIFGDDYETYTIYNRTLKNGSITIEITKKYDYTVPAYDIKKSYMKYDGKKIITIEETCIFMVMDDKSLEIVRDDLKPNDYVRKLWKDNNYMIFDYEIHREIIKHKIH